LPGGVAGDLGLLQWLEVRSRYEERGKTRQLFDWRRGVAKRKGSTGLDDPIGVLARKSCFKRWAKAVDTEHIGIKNMVYELHTWEEKRKPKYKGNERASGVKCYIE